MKHKKLITVIISLKQRTGWVDGDIAVFFNS